MNGWFNILIYRAMLSQRLLNKPLAKREINNWSVLYNWLYPQLFFWCVEILLRAYIFYCQHSYITIHRFNKKRWNYRDSSCSLVMV